QNLDHVISCAAKILRYVDPVADQAAVFDVLAEAVYGRQPYCHCGAEALHWFSQAAKQGQPRAQVIVSELYTLGRGVVVSDDDRTRRVPVSTGIRGEQLFEITRGVAADTLVLSPARNDLKDGTRVRVQRPSIQEAKPAGSPDKNDLAVSTSLS